MFGVMPMHHQDFIYTMVLQVKTCNKGVFELLNYISIFVVVFTTLTSPLDSTVVDIDLALCMKVTSGLVVCFEAKQAINTMGTMR